MKIKKLILLLLALIMCLSSFALVGCKEDDDTNDDIPQAETPFKDDTPNLEDSPGNPELNPIRSQYKEFLYLNNEITDNNNTISVDKVFFADSLTSQNISYQNVYGFEITITSLDNVFWQVFGVNSTILESEETIIINLLQEGGVFSVKSVEDNLYPGLVKIEKQQDNKIKIYYFAVVDSVELIKNYDADPNFKEQHLGSYDYKREIPTLLFYFGQKSGTNLGETCYILDVFYEDIVFHDSLTI